MSTLKASEADLFARWRRRRPDLISDGLVDEPCYMNSGIKVVFLFKEANSPGIGGWDLVADQLRTGGSGTTWCNAARWTYGLQNLDKEVRWDELESWYKNHRMKSLWSSCYINLNKSPGGSSSDDKEIELAATVDRDLILEQIKLYRPQLIVCGGTGDVAFQLFGKLKGDWKLTSRGVYWFLTNDSVPVIAIAHPAARIGAAIQFYTLVDAAREILMINGGVGVA